MFLAPITNLVVIFGNSEHFFFHELSRKCSSRRVASFENRESSNSVMKSYERDYKNFTRSSQLILVFFYFAAVFVCFDAIHTLEIPDAPEFTRSSSRSLPISSAEDRRFLIFRPPSRFLIPSRPCSHSRGESAKPAGPRMRAARCRRGISWVIIPGPVSQ